MEFDPAETFPDLSDAAVLSDTQLDDERRLTISEYQSYVQRLDAALRHRIHGRTASTEDYIQMGIVLSLQGRHQRAFRLLRSLLARQDLEVHYASDVLCELGWILLVTRTRDLGESYFKRALETMKGNLRAMEGLARSLEFRQHYEEAIPVATRLAKVKERELPHLGSVYAASALTCMKAGDLSKAKRYANKAVDLADSFPFPHLALCDVLIECGHYDDAISHLGKFVSRWPKWSFLALRRMEDAHYRKNAFPEYENTLRECIRKNPENHYLIYSLGRHLKKKKRYNESLQHFEQAWRLNPLYVNALRDQLDAQLRGESVEKMRQGLAEFFRAFKQSRRFICRECKTPHPKLSWQCKNCGQWGEFEIRYELPAP